MPGHYAGIGAISRMAQKIPPPVPYWRTATVALAERGERYKRGDRLTTNKFFTVQQPSFTVRQVNEDGGITDLFWDLAGYSRVQPVIATMLLQGGHGVGAMVTFSYSHHTE